MPIVYVLLYKEFTDDGDELLVYEGIFASLKAADKEMQPQLKQRLAAWTKSLGASQSNRRWAQANLVGKRYKLTHQMDGTYAWFLSPNDWYDSYILKPVKMNSLAHKKAG